jgi:hypothetical protein
MKVHYEEQDGVCLFEPENLFEAIIMNEVYSELSPKIKNHIEVQPLNETNVFYIIPLFLKDAIWTLFQSVKQHYTESFHAYVQKHIGNDEMAKLRIDPQTLVDLIINDISKN